MTMEKRIVQTPEAPAAVGTYSQGVQLGDVYYFSGQIGLNPETMEMANSTEIEVEQILKNVDALLESQGLKRGQIVKTTIFLTDLKDFSLVNTAYEKYFQTPYPARSCVQVSALPKGATVEIEVIAANS